MAIHGANYINSDYLFSHIKISDGLPHQQIQAMAFDRIGRLWIGTRNGLACYDGYSFKTYYHIPGDTSSLCHNFVIQLLVDSKDNIWVGTEKGICKYIPETDSFQSYDVGGERIKCLTETKEGCIIIGETTMQYLLPGQERFNKISRQEDGYIVGMAISPDNRIYISTNKSIASYDSSLQSVSFLDSKLYSDFLMGFDDIVPLFFDRDGYMWIGRNGKGAMCLDLKSGKTKIYEASILTDGTVRAIAQDNSGKIWLGTEKGINVINPETDEIEKIQQNFVNSHKLNDNAVYCIVPDSSDNIWIGTYFGGINLVKNRQIKFNWLAPGYDRFDLSGKAIRRISEPEKGILWLATEDGGLNIMDMSNHQVTLFDKIPSLGVNVHELFYDRNTHDMWIGSFRNGLFRYNIKTGKMNHYLTGHSGLGSDAIFSIVKQNRTDSDDRLWIGTTFGLQYYIPETDSFGTINSPILDHEFIYCMLVDKSNNLWLGTVNNGLFKIDSMTGEVHGWNKTANSDGTGLKDCYISALYQDLKGRIYIGTDSGGLYVLDKDDQIIRPFSDEANTFGTICSITGDKNGLVWVSTSKGLYSLDIENGGVHHFSTADGLPENQFNFSSALMASDGKLYFGTVNGLISFDPDIKKAEGSPQAVHLWDLLINNETINPLSPDSPLETRLDLTPELRLAYSESRSFTILYGIVDPASADQTNYQVLMEGIDKDWRDVGNQRSFTAMDLAFGTYKLRIRATSDSENWEAAPVRELVIKIAPPFYL